MLSDCRTRSARNGDGSNKFGSMDVDAAGDDDTDDDGLNEFNSDADVNNDTGPNGDADTDDDGSNDFNSDAEVNNNTGANVDADDDEDDTAIRANDPCKLVSTVIGEITSCRSVIR